MKDKTTILLGLGVFIVLATFPIWFTLASGKPGYVPDPELPEGESRCVESLEFMKSWHMDLLDEWRDDVVRNGNRIYVSKEYGTRHEMSLTKTCLKCHDSKAKFCDQCHDYLGVVPYCWDCHVDPGAQQTGGE